MAKPRFFTDTLNYMNSSHWSIDAFEYFDQNVNTSHFFMPFEASLVPTKHKIYKPTMVPKVKTDYRRPNYYDLKMKMFQNESINVEDKSINKISLNILGDSLCFTVGASSY